MNDNKNLKLNIIPFISDVALFIVAFFIVIIVLQQLQIKDSIALDDIDTSLIFQSASFEIKESQMDKLKNKIIGYLTEGENAVLNLFNSGSIERILIEGHADIQQPDETHENFIDNRMLSVLRAETIKDIIEEIVNPESDYLDSNKLSQKKFEEFKTLLFTGGYGDLKPKCIYCGGDDKYTVHYYKESENLNYKESENLTTEEKRKEWCGINSDNNETLITEYYYATSYEAKRQRDAKNRRIEITVMRK